MTAFIALQFSPHSSQVCLRAADWCSSPSLTVHKHFTAASQPVSPNSHRIFSTGEEFSSHNACQYFDWCNCPWEMEAPLDFVEVSLLQKGVTSALNNFIFGLCTNTSPLKYLFLVGLKIHSFFDYNFTCIGHSVAENSNSACCFINMFI